MLRLGEVSPLLQGLRKQKKINRTSTQPPALNNLQPSIPHTPHLYTDRQTQARTPSPVTRSRCLSVWVMTRVYLYVCVRVSVYPDGIILWLQILPHLIWEGPGGSSTGEPRRKTLSKYEWEKQRSRCVCVCTVILVCQSGKCMQLLGLHKIQLI